jgi:hypothetical protein
MRTWSKLGTERASLKNLQSQQSPSSHFRRKLYGKIKDAQGPESYEDNGPKGIRVQVTFDDASFDALYSDRWFPFNIAKDKFTDSYQSVESLKARLEDDPVYVTFEYTYPTIMSGTVQLSSSTKEDFTGVDNNPSYTMSGLINGIMPKRGKVTRTIKPSATSKSETGITLSEGSIRVAADGKNFVEVTTEGTTIGGKLNLQMMSSDVKVAGIFGFQNPIYGLIPSTTYTPTSQFSFALPIESILAFKDIALLAASMMG